MVVPNNNIGYAILLFVWWLVGGRGTVVVVIAVVVKALVPNARNIRHVRSLVLY